MFKIQDGREQFYQWDIDRKLIVSDSGITQVHFCNRTDDCSLVVDVKDGLADVPNILLQDDWKINVYAYDKNYTKHCQTFNVVKRTKPSDYVYTETEVKRYEDFEEDIKQLSIAIGNKADKEEWIIIDDFTLATDSTGITRTTDRNYKPFKCKKIYCLCSIANGIGSQRTVAFPALDSKRVNLIVPANAFGFECSVEVLNQYGLIKYEGQAYTEKTLQVGNHGQIVKCVNNTTSLTSFSLYPQNGWTIPAGAHIQIWGLKE